MNIRIQLLFLKHVGKCRDRMRLTHARLAMTSPDSSQLAVVAGGGELSFLATMASYEEVGIGDAVLLDEISVGAFVDNLRVR